MGISGADGQLQGFDIDIARIIAKGLFNDPDKVQFVQQSSDARIPNLLTDKVDLTCQAMTVTAQRAQQVAFTIPYYREGGAVAAGEWQVQATGRHERGRLVATRGGIAKRVCRATGTSGAAQSDRIAVRQRRPDVSGAKFRRADAVATDQSSARWLMVQTPDVTTRRIMPGVRKPTPAH